MEPFTFPGVFVEVSWLSSDWGGVCPELSSRGEINRGAHACWTGSADLLRVWVGLGSGERAGDESPMGLLERMIVIVMAVGGLRLV